MKNLFSQIETLVPTCGDWCSVEKGQTLAAIVLAFRPKVTVEIGVFSGASFLPMALAHKFIKHGAAYAIDPWSKDASVEGLEAPNANWWKEVDHDRIYQLFLSKAKELGVDGISKVIRAKSDDVKPPSEIGLLHVDGNHGAQAVKDVARFAPNVHVGGICVMDDIGWQENEIYHVREAVDNLYKMGFVKLYDLGTGAVFQRISK